MEGSAFYREKKIGIIIALISVRIGSEDYWVNTFF